MPVYAYLAPVIGDGQSVDTAYRLSIADLAQAQSRFYIPTDRNGVPRFSWGLGIVSADASTHMAIQAMAGVSQLPKFRTSTLLSDVPAGMRVAVQNKMTSLGMDYTSLTNKSTYRDLLLLVAKSLEPGIKSDEMDDLST